MFDYHSYKEEFLHQNLFNPKRHLGLKNCQKAQLHWKKCGSTADGTWMNDQLTIPEFNTFGPWSPSTLQNCTLRKHGLISKVGDEAVGQWLRTGFLSEALVLEHALSNKIMGHP